MKVIHICGESGVGKNHLLKEVRWIESKIGKRYLKDFEKSLLDRFEITEPFTVLDPLKGSVSLSDLRDRIKNLIENKKHETIIHHWQYPSHSLFYHINRIDPKIHQKTFLLWRDREYHLRDLQDENLPNRGKRYSGWDDEMLKKLFVELYDYLHPVKMTGLPLEKLKAHSPGEDLEKYKKELFIDVEVVVSTPNYCTISGTELDKLTKKS